MPAATQRCVTLTLLAGLLLAVICTANLAFAQSIAAATARVDAPKAPVANPALDALAQEGLQEMERMLYQSPESPVGGNPQGNLTIVEFFDYTCANCRRSARALRQMIAQDAGIRVVFKEFPVGSRNAEQIARAALAAHRQGKYLEMHWALMSTSQHDEGALDVIARRLGLDVARLRADMQSPALGRALQDNLRLARMLRISATPTFVVGDSIYASELNFEGLSEAVRKERTKAKP